MAIKLDGQSAGGAILRTFPLSDADMAELAAGNPVEVLAGVPGVVHTGVSGVLSIVPGVVPYNDNQMEAYVTYASQPTGGKGRKEAGRYDDKNKRRSRDEPSKNHHRVG